MEWHLIRDPADPELDRLAERYHLHPLHIEDCRHRNQSAKIEENGGYLFVVLKPVHMIPDNPIDVSDLDLFVGRDFLITVEEGDCPGVRATIDALVPLAPRRRPDELLYRIADAVVDSYLPTLDYFNDRIDNLQDEVLEAPRSASLSRIFQIKRSLIELRRVLVNTRDVAGRLQRTESELIQRDMWPFLRDIYDHVARNLDTVDIQRDLLSGSVDVYLSSVANRTNQVMKVLTVLSTVALPMLVLSSIYGMNVEGLPWAHSAYATLILISLMALSTVVLLLVLRWFKWL